jgi:hypothetical protein
MTNCPHENESHLEYIITVVVIIIIIIIIIIITALQPCLGPWPLFQFLDHIHSR